MTTILNTGDIKKYLRSFAEFSDEGLRRKLGDYLIAALAGPLKIRSENLREIAATNENWPDTLKNKFNTRADPWQIFKPDPALSNDVRHIADWIKAAMVNDDKWIKDIDDKGIPLALRTIRSLDQASSAADLAMVANEIMTTMGLNDDRIKKEQDQWLGRDEEAEGHIAPEMTLSDGSRIVRLLTADALDRESAFLRHCIGRGSYDDQLGNGKWAFYSLRDANNKPHATFAVNLETNTLVQCKGAQNAPPVEKYFPAVQEFVKARRFNLGENAGHTGLVLHDGVYHDVFNLPEGFVCKTGIVLVNIKRALSLPDNLSVAGSLDLSGCTGLTTLPDNLSVAGNLYLMECTSLTALPDGLSVGSSLFLNNCTSLTTLPDNLSVGGSLRLDYCTALTALPRNLSVKDSLNLWCCASLTALPDNLSIKGHLNLWGCASLTALPDNLSVDGELNLRGCSGLRELPQNLKAGSLIRTDFGKFLSVAGTRAAFDQAFSQTRKSISPPTPHPS